MDLLGGVLDNISASDSAYYLLTLPSLYETKDFLTYLRTCSVQFFRFCFVLLTVNAAIREATRATRPLEPYAMELGKQIAIFKKLLALKCLILYTSSFASHFRRRETAHIVDQ